MPSKNVLAVKMDLKPFQIRAVDAWRCRLVLETGEILSRPAAIKRMMEIAAPLEFAAAREVAS